MTRITGRIAAVLAALLMVIASSGTPAQASENFGRVIDLRGASIWIDCSLGSRPHADHLLHQKASGRKYKSTQFSGCSDADAFYLRYDKRCILYHNDMRSGGGEKYRADPGHWFKIPGLHTATGLAWSECPSNAPWISSVLRRLS